MLLKKTVSYGSMVLIGAVLLIFVYGRMTSLSGPYHATVSSKQNSNTFSSTRKVVAQDDLHGKTISPTVKKIQPWDKSILVSNARILQSNYVISKLPKARELIAS